jgi:hypothetical protein
MPGMDNAGRSVYFFGLYLYAIGAFLLFFPDVLLRLFLFESTKEVWIRIIGLLAIDLGYFYHQSAINKVVAVYRMTIPTRVMACIVFLALSALRMAEPQLVIFGLIDLAGAFWTWQALKAGGSRQKAESRRQEEVISK